MGILSKWKQESILNLKLSKSLKVTFTRHLSTIVVLFLFSSFNPWSLCWSDFSLYFQYSTALSNCRQSFTFFLPSCFCLNYLHSNGWSYCEILLMSLFLHLNFLLPFIQMSSFLFHQVNYLLSFLQMSSQIFSPFLSHCALFSFCSQYLTFILNFLSQYLEN